MLVASDYFSVSQMSGRKASIPELKVLYSRNCIPSPYRHEETVSIAATVVVTIIMRRTIISSMSHDVRVMV